MAPSLQWRTAMTVRKALELLEQSLRGRLIRPDSAVYDEARALYNAMIDKRPYAIVQCADPADVIHALRFAEDSGRAIAVRGGGHNGAGLGSCDDGIVIDLGNMRSVRVDPVSGLVRADAGCRQGDVDHATHPFGLAVPAGIIATTGLAGLTLGGGHGHITRRCGLTCDNLVSADVVLADGKLVTASADDHADLFWALRGGGGNFGIVTSFEFRAHPVHTVFGGPMFWRLEDAPRVMAWYREFLPNAPREVSAFLGLKSIPSADPFPAELHGNKVCALIWCYTGPIEQARDAMRPVRALPPPLLDLTGPLPFPALQSMFDPLLPPGLQWYWKGDFVRELPDAAIETHVAHAAEAPSETSLMHLYPIDGAVHDVAADATAWRFRDVTWSMVIAGIDPDPANAQRVSDWAQQYWSAVHPHTAGGAYVNFLMEEGQERVQATYGPNLPRLAAVKKRYDPTNLFHINQNIAPAE
jgi:FAD/FMN-containing dehydrogenase